MLDSVTPLVNSDYDKCRFVQYVSDVMRGMRFQFRERILSLQKLTFFTDNVVYIPIVAFLFSL